MKNNKILNILKWVWLIVVVLGAAWYIFTNFASISQSIRGMQPIRIMASFLLILLGKLLTTDLSFQSLRIVQHPIQYKESFSISTVTQLGKYLPGGIWHFAGKFSVYKSRGMKTKDASLPMILENMWLFSSAFVIGTLALLFSDNQVICGLFPFICDLQIKLVISVALIVLWIGALILIPKFIFKKPVQNKIQIRVIIEQILVWCIFGLSLWVFLPSASTPNMLLLTISSFSISWLAGYAAFFAPGGIGIREVVLTLILGSVLAGDVLTIYVSIHRLLWVLAEILLGVGSALLIGMPFTKTEQQKTGQE